MPLKSYLSPRRVLLLKGNDHEAVVQELVEVLCSDVPHLEASTVLAAVAERESEASTRFAPTIALPHARLTGIGELVLAVGLSRDGIQWDIERDESPVQVVVMLLGDADRPKDHVRALAELAYLFSRPDALPTLQGSTSDMELYHNLLSLQEDAGASDDQAVRQRGECLLLHAARLAGELDAQAVIVLGAERARRLALSNDATGKIRWILAASPELQAKEAVEPLFDEVLEVPSRGLIGRQRVDVVILLCLLQQLIRPNDTVVCVYGRHAPSQVDTVRVVDVGAQFGELWQLSDEIGRGDIELSVLYRVLQLANDIAIEGREGHPVGTLFVLGDYERVAQCCHQLVVNPFRGYTEAEMDILDPSLEETLKEFAQIDGAFLVRGDGIIMAAGACVQAPVPSLDAFSGLGTRHAAGAAISAATDALAVVLSQSTGTVSVYKGGKLILSLSQRN
jgi:DNA integrity scanning protein DisA with diadenylate cyclase activity/mannitol/fructose-specific phosphotransferase system IIA component (Ntr-type)